MIKFKNLFSFSRKEVAHAFSQGKLFCRGKNIKIITAPLMDKQAGELSHSKLLIVTSRKIGKAHDRNLLRRRVKEIFYGHELYSKQQAMFVFLTYPGSTELSYQELETLLKKCFSKSINATE